MCRQPLTPTNAVPYPSEKSDVGMCILKYAFCLSSADSATFSTSSFDTDGHERSISGLPSLCVCPDVLNRLRLDVLTLILEVTCKYKSVRQFEDNVTNPASTSKHDAAGVQHCDDDVHDMSIVGSSTSNFD